MPIPEVHPPDQAGRTGGDPGEEEYSPAFAARALLLTLVLLAGAVAAVWGAVGWPVGGP